MKICFLLDTNSIHARRWVEYFVKSGNEVYVISPSGPEIKGVKSYFWPIYYPKSYLAKIWDYGSRFINYWWFSLKHRYLVANLKEFSKTLAFSREVRFNLVSNSKWISNKIKEIKPDLVHMHYLNYLEFLFAVIIEPVSGPLVVSVWGDDVQEQMSSHSPLLKTTRREVLKIATVVTSPSIFLANQTKKYIGESLNVEIVPFGADLDKFKPSGNEKGSKKIGFIKYFLPGYGAEFFIKSIKSIVASVPGATFLMAGPGNQEYYQKLADKEGVRDLIQFLGPIDYNEMPDYLNSLTVYVMPSEFEAFGVSAVEAQACGIPVVASRVGGIPEVVKDGITGILVTPKDPKEISKAVINLITEWDIKEFSHQARKNVEENFSWEKNALRMEQLYQKVIRSNE